MVGETLQKSSSWFEYWTRGHNLAVQTTAIEYRKEGSM